jgi:hypothetical protein
MLRLFSVEVDDVESHISWGLHWFLRHTSSRLRRLKVQLKTELTSELQKNIFVGDLEVVDGNNSTTMLPPQALSSLTVQKFHPNIMQLAKYSEWILSESQATLHELHLAGRLRYDQVACITSNFNPNSNNL